MGTVTSSVWQCRSRNRSNHADSLALDRACRPNRISSTLTTLSAKPSCRSAHSSTGLAGRARMSSLTTLVSTSIGNSQERVRTVDPRGDLVLRTAAGDIRKPRPLVYQDDGEHRRTVNGGYVLSGDGQVTFEVGPYDPMLPLVIDPVVAYSTFWGGTGNDGGRRIAVDIQGNVYVVGDTASADFPTTAGAKQPTSGGNGDVFVTKFSPTGAVIYSTYIGGDCAEPLL